MTSNEIKESLERLLHGTSKDLSAYLLEVCSSETVQDTKTDLHVHMLRLDGNNRPLINDFANFVTDCVINYCIPPSEIREAKSVELFAFNSSDKLDEGLWTCENHQRQYQVE